MGNLFILNILACAAKEMKKSKEKNRIITNTIESSCVLRELHINGKLKSFPANILKNTEVTFAIMSFFKSSKLKIRANNF